MATLNLAIRMCEMFFTKRVFWHCLYR